MKHLTLFSRPFIFSLVIVVCSLSGCSKSDNGGGLPNNNPYAWNDGTLSANLAGTNWTANSVYAVDSSNTIFIFAATDHNANAFPMLLMTFPDNTAQGSTISFDLSKLIILQYYENSTNVFWAEPAMGGSGTITISKFNKSSKRIEGSFTAVTKTATAAPLTKNITAGQFAVDYR